MTSILLADDHLLVRAGVRQLLEKQDRSFEIFEASDWKSAIQEAITRRPDLAILDAIMPGGDPVDGIERLRKIDPELRILIMSGMAEDHLGLRILKAGAHGFVSKSAVAKDLTAAIESVLSGGHYLSPKLSGLLIDASFEEPTRRDTKYSRLSQRERQVVEAISSGKTLNEVAQEMNLSVKTISTYRSRVFDKLDFRNTAQLMRWWITREDSSSSRRDDLEYLKDLIGSFAHSLRNELFNIYTMAELLADRESSGSAGNRTLNSILRSAQYSSALLEKLCFPLGASKSGVGQVKLGEILENLQEMLQDRLAGSVEIQQEDADARTATVLADAQSILSVLIELVDNAARNLGTSGGRITLSTTVLESRVQISVTDSGPGIPEDLIGHLFKHRIEESDGSGVGLLFCRSAIRACGGEVELTSTGPEGTTFKVTLLRTDEPDE